MTASKEGQLVIPLNEGIVEDYVEDINAGAVTESQNTRLSVNKGTLARRPEIVDAGTAAPNGEPCGGFVPGPGNSIVAYFKPLSGQKRLHNGQVDELVSPLDSAEPQNAWYPYEMVDSGEAFTVRSGNPPAVVIDADGNIWMAVIGSVGSTFGIYVIVYDASGNLIAPQQLIITPTTALAFPQNSYLFKSLTAWTSGYVTLVYADDTSIYAAKLTVANSVVTVASGPTNVASPLNTGLIEADACGDGFGHTYILHRHPSTNTSSRVSRVNDATHAVSATLDFATTIAAGGIASFSCSHVLVVSARRLLIGISHSAGASAYVRVVDGSTVTLLSSNAFAIAAFVSVSVLPYVNGSTISACLAMSHQGSAFVFTDQTKTTFKFYDMATGTLLGTASVDWMIALGTGAYHKVSDGEIYPYFPMVPFWYTSLGGYSPSVGNYVIDPAVSLMTPSSLENMTVVARYGVDRAANNVFPVGIGNTISCYGSDMVCTYKFQDQARAGLSAYGDTSSFVRLELEPDHQPSTSTDSGGSSTVAAAYPVVWDGQETIDVCPPHTPKVKFSATGGAGGASVNLTGVYSVRAVHSWRDKAGNLHRSPPSQPETLTLAGTKPTVAVTAPLIMKNGVTQDYADVTLYMTEAGGSIFYAIPLLPDAGYPTTLGCYMFNAIPDTDASLERLYSTGADNEPLLPECPPPAWDVATIGSRQWLINAEYRNRLHPSKLKEQGVAWEYNAALAIDIDRQYGKLMKVVDVGGRVVVLAERGIWSIGGYGPDNSGQGSGFSDPQLLVNTGCKYRHSVAQIPGIGVMFQAEDGKFALFGGNGIERFERIEIYEVAAPVVHVLECEVVYPISNGTGYIVYNWLAKGWTKWSNPGVA